MAEEVVFVVNPLGWARAFNTWTGAPVGTWMERKLQTTRTMVQLEAPGPGKTPRNRTGFNYSRGILEKSILARHDRATNGKDLEGHVTSLAAYSGFVHGGTKPHLITPKSPAGILRFKTRTGATVFTKLVHPPGTAAKPFMVRALKRVFG